MVRLVIAIIVASACGKGSEPAATATGSGSAGSNAVVVAPNAGSGSGSGSGSAAPVALSPKIKAARCGEPCLFLVDTPYEKLTDTYTAECGGMKTKDLGYEDCQQLDYMRNCIYAAHGLVYKKKKWKLFAAKPWYEAHADFDAKSISELERTNVHELNTRGKACKKGLSVSGADYERLKAWFAAIPKPPPLPAALIAYYEPADAKTFLAKLNKALGGKKVRLGGGITAEYEDAEHLDVTLPELNAALKPAANAKLRAIRVLIAPSDRFEGAQLDLVYDDNALVGVELGTIEEEGD